VKPDFLAYLRDHVVLGDGALGSYLYERGVELGANLDLLNLKAPDLVFSAHEEYVRAGSQLIETNTFGANTFKLREAGSEDLVEEINRRGAEIAVKAAGHQVFVAGSIGPTGVSLRLDEEPADPGALRESFRRQCLGLAEGGVDCLILETFSELDEILLAIETARQTVPHLPVIAQMVFPARGRTTTGEDALACGRQALVRLKNTFGREGAVDVHFTGRSLTFEEGTR